jgi:hypothetical protein
MKLIQKGNSKLHNAYMFNIQATKQICSMECPGCYARKEQIRFPKVLEVREQRYEVSTKADFAMKIIDEIQKLRNKPKYFRIHASGEMYSQVYINKWVQIVKSNPDIIFYTYTKRLADFDFSVLKELPNMVLINSLHFKTINYGKLEQAPKEAFICPVSKATRCGIECSYCMTKQAQNNGVYFIKH